MGYIYKISNTVNNRVYIGQTVFSIEERWKQHISASFDTGFRGDNLLYRAMRKYGRDKFHIETIEKVEDNKLSERETYWIKYYDSYNNGYNMTLGGEGVILYDINTFLELWNKGYSTSEIADMVGCCQATVSRRLQVIIPNFIELSHQRGHEKPREDYKNRDEIIKKMWEEGKSGTEIKEFLGVDISTIKRHLKRFENFSEKEFKKRNGKFQGQRQKTQVPIRQLSLEGKEIATFPSMSEAARSVGDASMVSNIRKCLIGKIKTAYGYKWQYADKEN